MKKEETYGTELILDMHHCDVSTFNRASIKAMCVELCEAIDMNRCDLHFWDDMGVHESERQTDPKTTGTSAVQFILTSNITIHTLDKLGKCFVNLFSCKKFDSELAASLIEAAFGGQIVNTVFITRI